MDSQDCSRGNNHGFGTQAEPLDLVSGYHLRHWCLGAPCRQLPLLMLCVLCTEHEQHEEKTLI